MSAWITMDQLSNNVDVTFHLAVAREIKEWPIGTVLKCATLASRPGMRKLMSRRIRKPQSFREAQGIHEAETQVVPVSTAKALLKRCGCTTLVRNQTVRASLSEMTRRGLNRIRHPSRGRKCTSDLMYLHIKQRIAVSANIAANTCACLS